jgi:hypothetical protein
VFRILQLAGNEDIFSCDAALLYRNTDTFLVAVSSGGVNVAITVRDGILYSRNGGFSIRCLPCTKTYTWDLNTIM